MSVPVSGLITQALDEIGDKDGHRTTRPDMLRYYDRVQSVLATDTQALEVDAYFDLEANEPRYAYPEDCIQITAIRVSRTATPTSLSDYYWLDEVFEEEYRTWTWAQRAIGWISTYRARNAWIEFLQNPTQDIVNGGLLTYARMSVDVVSESQAAVMELPDFMKNHVIEGMKIVARMAGRERAAANDDWVKWQAKNIDLKTAITDRSRDRKASIRPPSFGNMLRGMR